MRAVVQRVSSAQVAVDGDDVVGLIEKGLLVYLGFGHGDGEEEREYMLAKLRNLRIFEDESGKMNLALEEVEGAILVISQFTLYGDVRRGRRPSFDDAMSPKDAEREYDAFVYAARQAAFALVETGRFGKHMDVTSVNDGPVTILIDTATRGSP